MITSTNCVDALNKVEKRLPALILSDVKMSQLSGYHLCKLIKRDERTRAIPVILLSDKSGVVNRWRGSMSGCKEMIVKPFQSLDLIETVRNHVLVEQPASEPIAG